MAIISSSFVNCSPGPSERATSHIVVVDVTLLSDGHFFSSLSSSPIFTFWASQANSQSAHTHTPWMIIGPGFARSGLGSFSSPDRHCLPPPRCRYSHDADAIIHRTRKIIHSSFPRIRKFTRSLQPGRHKHSRL